jgi:hypothetical protein
MDCVQTQRDLVIVNHAEKVSFLMNYLENVEDDLIIIGPGGSGKTATINEAFDNLLEKDSDIAINFILWNQSEIMKTYRNSDVDFGYKLVSVRWSNDELVNALCQDKPNTIVVYFEPDLEYEINELIDYNYNKTLTKFA